MPYKRGTRPLAKKAPKRKRIYAKKSNATVAMVKKMINKSQESKMNCLDSGLVNYNGEAQSAGDCKQVVPDIGAGTLENTRIGTDIRCVSLRVMGHINSNPIHLDKPRSRMLVRMMVVQPKTYRNISTATFNSQQWMNDVLRFGSGTQGLDGSIKSMYLPVNRDVVTCFYDRKIYLKTDYYEDAQTGNFNISFATRFFDFTLKVKNKILKYNSAQQLVPNDYAPILLFSYCFLDGSPQVFTTTAIAVQYVSTLVYKDA